MPTPRTVDQLSEREIEIGNQFAEAGIILFICRALKGMAPARKIEIILSVVEETITGVEDVREFEKQVYELLGKNN